MAADTTIGPEGNLLEPMPASAHQIKLATPILSNEELEKLRALGTPKGRSGAWAFKSVTIPILFRPERGRRRPRARARRDLPLGHGGHPPGQERRRALGPRHRPRAGADPGPARGRGRPPSPDPRGHAHPGGPRARERRAARDPPPGAADRLRGRRRQPVPRLRDRPRHGAARPAAERRRGARGQELRQGAHQGHREGHLEDGDLHDPELLRGADLRGDRPRARAGRALLRRDAVADRRDRHRDRRRGGAAPSRAAFATKQLPETLESGGQYKWRHDGERHLFNPETIHKLQYACRTGDYRIFKEYSQLVDDQSQRLSHAARPDGR